MKLFLLFVIFYSGQLMAQIRVYDIRIQAIDGKTISMASFKGKKIIVASVSPDNLQKSELGFLDSLQVKNPSVTVIAVPATDFMGTDDPLKIDGIKKTGSLHIIVAAADGVKKANGTKQNKLLQWLTSSSQNTHFDADVQTDNQLYIISETGVLYAVLAKGASAAFITQLIKQADVKL